MTHYPFLTPLGAKAIREKARAHYTEVIPVVAKLRESGLSFAAIAAHE